MRVGSRMLQFCTLASSGAFQAVLGMGDGFRTAQDLEGSSGIGGRHLPMRRIQDGASGSSTVSPDINLELKKGKSGGMREQQCIRPPNDSKGVAGKMLTLATGGSGSLRPVKLEKMDEGSESSSGIGSGHMPMRRIQDRASGSSRPGSQDIGLDWQKAKLGGKRKQQWIDSFNDSEVMADPMTALPTGGSKSLRRVKLEKIGQGSTPLDRIRISHIKADEKLNGWIKEISAFSSELERKLDSMEINNMLAPNLALYPLLEEKFKSVRSGVTKLFQEKSSQLALATPLVNETAFKSKLKELEKNFLQSVAEIQVEEDTTNARVGDYFFWNLSRTQRWCETIMNLVLDLKNNEILQDPLLSHFLNKQTHGQLIWQYLNARIYPSSHTLFLNFDSKLTLQEDASMNKYSNILQLLTDKTWQIIELQNINYNSGMYMKKRKANNTSDSSFEYLKELFLAAVGVKLNTTPSEKPMANFIDLVIHHISKHSRLKIEKTDDLTLMNVKIIYDMLRYALHYHSKAIPTEQIQKNFYELKVFEEAVGLLGSAAHTVHIRLMEIVHTINGLGDEAKKILPETIVTYMAITSKFMTDSNENRKVSILDLMNMEGAKVKLKKDDNSLIHPQSRLAQMLINNQIYGTEDLQKSTKKSKEQCNSYEESVKLYKQSNMQKSDLPEIDSFLLGGAWKTAFSELERVDKFWFEYVNTHNKNSPHSIYYYQYFN